MNSLTGRKKPLFVKKKKMKVLDVGMGYLGIVCLNASVKQTMNFYINRLALKRLY